ncbi:MAG: hypothetical protein A2381_01520 [Bdellovibrionales bacterium RIFOXYB1_FULL_37_110]|nr:MAG: hypothetical protein A2417_02375 [Bdellovibrionales bacterium RIFOXYC1_FULL_37_79]OFZ58895.1 MAG: hypothetical protein A2381_01520 [Bdellovibrionales bacterium RIFOXYB1_FULL_37_110]OFZ64659.1 MAG: hypothetical protein A2577_13415 [Bdellovibrionales bacterium RIFOXYD1_FULL_36_51]
MKLLNAVKRVLSASLIFYILLFADVLACPEFSCGTHQIHGKLLQNDAGLFVISVFSEGFRCEFILLGGSFDEKVSHVNTTVSAVIYVPRTITDNESPFVFFQNFMDTPKADFKFKKITDEPCKLQEKYKADSGSDA